MRFCAPFQVYSFLFALTASDFNMNSLLCTAASAIPVAVTAMMA
jgi:hypothetical protein